MQKNNLIFIDHYNELYTTTKKKFFKKNNLIEIQNELKQIGQNLSNFHHSAQISHHMLNKQIEMENPTLRIRDNVKLTSARNLLQKELDEYRFGIPFTGDNYTIAMKTFYEIVDELKTTEFKTFAVNLLCELANYSIKFDQLADAMSHLNVAINLRNTCKDYYYYFMCYKMAECAILMRNYFKCYEILQDFIYTDPCWNTFHKLPTSFVCQLNITNILILLIILPHEFENLSNPNNLQTNSKMISRNMLKSFIDSTFNSTLVTSMCLPLHTYYTLKSLITQFHNGNFVQLQIVEQQLSPVISDINSLLLYEILSRSMDSGLCNSII